jgi:hypothetical protein
MATEAEKKLIKEAKTFNIDLFPEDAPDLIARLVAALELAVTDRDYYEKMNEANA